MRFALPRLAGRPGLGGLRATAESAMEPTPDLAMMATAVGAVAVGAALFEAALVPGIVLGAAALLAPGFAARHLPRVRRQVQSMIKTQPPKQGGAAPLMAITTPVQRLTALLPRVQVGEAVAKTITFRITIAALDFAWNYVILAELTTAAGLSALNLGVGPVFYFLHEAAWNYYTAPGPTGQGPGKLGIDVVPSDAPDVAPPLIRFAGYQVSRATAKTVFYETTGTISEFTVNYLVVGNLATAAIITAPLVVLGPFIYYGHEKAWEAYNRRAKLKLAEAAA